MAVVRVVGVSLVLRVALDDVSVTEWRLVHHESNYYLLKLHSMTSVLLNGGEYRCIST